MQYSEIMVRYGELSTKGKNRMRFINQLKRNMKHVLSIYPEVSIRADRDRAHIYLNGANYVPVAESLKQIFGIQAFSPSYKVEKSVPVLEKAVQAIMVELHHEGLTFKISSKRSDHQFELDSRELNQVLGSAVFAVLLDIKAQMKKALDIGIFIVVVIGLSFLFKFIIKKTITDNERLYTANKFINLVNITLIIMILLFAYIENVTYLVTVLGFASAGIAIAMKDMFMSMLGWTVVVFGGSFHVGDRIKVRKDGEDVVGDIIDISLLRMTIYEDVTIVTVNSNRRAGRIIFVPNNYIFTDLIANYSHHGMKTVWDGIDVVCSFESNHKKAAHIIKDIARKYSKGYTEIAKKQMSKLRNQYSIKNPNVEPRVFTFIEPYGVKISVWYMANTFATLSLRSTISAEIMEAIASHDDIVIAYPTQTLYMDRRVKAGESKPMGEGGEEKHEA